jgi:hypothetical protein
MFETDSQRSGSLPHMRQALGIQPSGTRASLMTLPVIVWGVSFILIFGFAVQTTRTQTVLEPQDPTVTAERLLGTKPQEVVTSTQLLPNRQAVEYLACAGWVKTGQQLSLYVRSGNGDFAEAWRREAQPSYTLTHLKFVTLNQDAVPSLAFVESYGSRGPISNRISIFADQ